MVVISVFYSMLMIFFIFANSIENFQFLLNKVNVLCDKWLI